MYSREANGGRFGTHVAEWVYVPIGFRYSGRWSFTTRAFHKCDMSETSSPSSDKREKSYAIKKNSVARGFLFVERFRPRSRLSMDKTLKTLWHRIVETYASRIVFPVNPGSDSPLRYDCRGTSLSSPVLPRDASDRPSDEKGREDELRKYLISLVRDGDGSRTGEKRNK